jgi:hypothetical protein
VNVVRSGDSLARQAFFTSNPSLLTHNASRVLSLSTPFTSLALPPISEDDAIAERAERQKLHYFSRLSSDALDRCLLMLEFEQLASSIVGDDMAGSVLSNNNGVEQLTKQVTYFKRDVLFFFFLLFVLLQCMSDCFLTPNDLVWFASKLL